MEKLGKTQSICPVCYSKIPAEKVKRDSGVFLEKACPEHGFFSTLIWTGSVDYQSWSAGTESRAGVPPLNAKPAEHGCPYDCGLCQNHLTETCCVLLELTKRCDLKCPVCYANAGTGEDVPIETVTKWFDYLLKRGKYNIQLSGGEPSVRNDLPEIIELGRKKGFDFFQLNTNGIRLSNDIEYAQRLKNAGLNCVFLQFDSLRDDAYLKIRGRKLADTKLKAVENAGKAGLGVVLVPTVVNGVNDCDVGSIINFAKDNMPVIRGVHFQPISFFGRYNPDFMNVQRITIPDMLKLIEEQTGGVMRAEHFTGGKAESAYCSFHGGFIKVNGKLRPSKAVRGGCCCSTPDKAREYVASRWSDPPEIETATKPDSLDEFLQKYEKGTLALSCMVFQDAWNLELDRLKLCYIHVIGKNGLVPFCAHNLALPEVRR